MDQAVLILFCFFLGSVEHAADGGHSQPALGGDLGGGCGGGGGGADAAGDGDGGGGRRPRRRRRPFARALHHGSPLVVHLFLFLSSSSSSTFDGPKKCSKIPPKKCRPFLFFFFLFSYFVIDSLIIFLNGIRRALHKRIIGFSIRFGNQIRISRTMNQIFQLKEE